MPSIGRWTLLPTLILLSGATAALSAQEAAGEAAAAEAEAEASRAATASEGEDAAVAAAAEWLVLVDAGDYEESWHEAGSAFQDAVTPEQWNGALQQARGPLEPFGERELMNAEYTTALPNAPAGEYVVIQYRTKVAGDRTVVETVVPTKTGDDWKVVGYFVQPE